MAERGLEEILVHLRSLEDHEVLGRKASRGIPKDALPNQPLEAFSRLRHLFRSEPGFSFSRTNLEELIGTPERIIEKHITSQVEKDELFRCVRTIAQHPQIIPLLSCSPPKVLSS